MRTLSILFIQLFMMTIAYAGSPLWTFTPITPTTISVASNSSATIKYIVTNQSTKPHTLAMVPMDGIVQVTIDPHACGNSFVLSGKESCVLTLVANGVQLIHSINDGPVVCQAGSTSQCYRPAASNILHVSKGPAISLPSGCIVTEDNNIQCTVTIGGQTNYGFTNMTYALCRSAQCDYDGIQTSVTCSCQLLASYQGIYSASVAPNDYNTSKPAGNIITSTYSMVNSSGETPTNCPQAPFANCFGASCIVNGSSVACNCPVVTTEPYIAPEPNCNLVGKIWSATSVSSFPSIEGTMLFIYNNFFGGNRP